MILSDPKGIPRTREEMQWSIDTGYVIPAFRDTSKITVEMLLDYVDLKLDWYVPSIEAFDFINFIRLCVGEEPENLNPKAHYFFIDCMFKSEEVKPYFEVRNMDFEELKGNTLILSSREFSKALHHKTLVATPDGNKMIRDINVGDKVISRTGKPTSVTNKSNLIIDDTYEIELEDGRKIIADRDHKHILWKRKSKYCGYYKDGKRCSKKDGGRRWVINGLEEIVLTTEELELSGATYNRVITDKQRKGYENKYYIPRIDKGIQYNPVHSPIDPYTVGVILGGGLVHNDDLENILREIPYDCKVIKRKGNVHTVTLPSSLNKDIANFIGTSRSYNKRVPSILLTGSVEQRLSVLQGLMDTDGTINRKGSPSFTTVSKGLAEDVVSLVQTLGGSARISERKTNSKFGVAYQVLISLNGYPLFRLQRKKDRETYIPARDSFAIKSIKLVHSQPAYCLTVDCSTESFVLANGLLTHNSTLIAYLILYMADKGRMPRFGKVNFGMYVSDKMDGNVKTTMQTIEALYLGSEYLKSRFEWTHFTDAAVEMIRKPRTIEEIKAYNKHMAMPSSKIETVPARMKRKFKVQGLGSSGGRGSRSALDRPQFAIFDDMVANEKDAYSKAIISSIDSTIEADVGSSLSGEGNFQILIGTAYHTGDPVYKRVTEGTFLPVVFPKAEVPPHGGIYDKNGRMIEPPMTKDRFVSVWPDRHPFEKQRKVYAVAERAAKKSKTSKLKTVNQEFYVRVTSEHERLIGSADIRWGNVQHVKDNAQNYSWYVTTDYTTTANKGSDDSVQKLWAIEWTGKKFLMMVHGGKQAINEQYENTLKMVRKAHSWGANMVEVGVEIDGQQVLHLIGLQRYAADHGVSIIFARQKEKLGKAVTWEGIRSKGSGDKLWRLHLIAGEFHDGNIIFDEDMKDFNPFMETYLGELKMTTGTEIKADSDNYLDTTSQLALIDLLVPEKPIQVKRGYNSINFDPTFMSHDRVTNYDDDDDGYY